LRELLDKRLISISLGFLGGGAVVGRFCFSIYSQLGRRVVYGAGSHAARRRWCQQCGKLSSGHPARPGLRGGQWLLVGPPWLTSGISLEELRHCWPSPRLGRCPFVTV